MMACSLAFSHRRSSWRATGLAAALGLSCTVPSTHITTETKSPPAAAPEADSAGPRAHDASAPAVAEDDGLVLADVDSRRLPPAQVEAGIPFVRFRVDVSHAPSRGPDDAPVTVVMFSDFECPYCQTGLEIVRTIEREYPGQVRFVYKAFPIDSHPHAIRAALMAHSAWAQQKFWPFHDRLFSQRGLSPEILDTYAQAVGLDIPRVHRELDALTYGVALRQDIRQARRFGVRSTPTFFINGRHIRGAQALDVFRSVVHQEVTLADKWRREQGPDLDVYQYATQYGYVAVGEPPSGEKLHEDLIYPVPLDKSPQRGPATARLTVVAFADFRCPYCARGQDVIEALAARYGDDLRVVYKHAVPPSHPLGLVAARAAMAAAAQGKFWPYHDALYQRRARYSEADLVAIAEQLGLDMVAFERARHSAEVDAAIQQDLELSERLGVTGTPTYFVNGRPIQGAQPEMSFRLLFAEEIERAQALLDRGVSPTQLYEVLTSAEGPA